MSAVGIIAEFNPLHKGHEYLINRAKQYGTVVCVISGNFVQRGDIAIAEKQIRAQSALLAGADVVIELPVLWSMSTAQNFALGAVSALKNAGCGKIIFGSEAGDISRLKKATDILISPQFKKVLINKLESGVTFAAARQNAAEELGLEKGILQEPNNNLGIEYMLAAKSLNYNPQFITVERRGAPHDSLGEDEFVSATLLRNKLRLGDIDFCKKYMPNNILPLFKNENISHFHLLERAILAVLRTKSRAQLEALPDLSEGVENKLWSALREAKTIDELYEKVKVKRYTLARIRRLVLNAFIGADNEFFMKPLPYLRVLGFSGDGEKYLKTTLCKAEVPVITRTAQFKELGEKENKIFKTECIATDLFGLSLPVANETGLEYTRKLIKGEDLLGNSKGT